MNSRGWAECIWKLAVSSYKSLCRVYNYLEKNIGYFTKKYFLQSYDFTRFSPEAKNELVSGLVAVAFNRIKSKRFELSRSTSKLKITFT